MLKGNPRVAIVHDWLTGMRGGEKCLEVFCELFPRATLFTLICDRGKLSPVIAGMDIKTSFLQKIPGIFKKYRQYLPLFPYAVKRFDLRAYDLVISSSHCVAKGVRKAPGALHVSYCYTPMRYAWSAFDDYFSSEIFIKKALIAFTLKRLKGWDKASNKKVDYFIAISHNVKTRINKFYGREADVIYPPVDLGPLSIKGANKPQGEGYYIVVSALVPYKRIDLAVEAFNENGKKLIIIGRGSEEDRLRKMASSNVEFIGWASDSEIMGYFSGAEALIFPGEEDFGIVPLEAQAMGIPVIAYGAGGVLETVIPLRDGEAGPTGIFFEEQTVQGLLSAIDEFEKRKDGFKPETLRENASKFGRDRFKKEIQAYIEDKWEKHGDMPKGDTFEHRNGLKS